MTRIEGLASENRIKKPTLKWPVILIILILAIGSTWQVIKNKNQPVITRTGFIVDEGTFDGELWINTVDADTAGTYIGWVKIGNNTEINSETTDIAVGENFEFKKTMTARMELRQLADQQFIAKKITFTGITEYISY